MIDSKQLKNILEVVFQYWHYTIGSAAVIAGFWLFFLKKIDKEMFAYIIGAVITLKWIWKPKEKNLPNEPR